MNWYKLAKQQEEERKWNRLLSWVGTGTILGLAIWISVSVTNLREEYARNPQAIEKKLIEYKNTVAEPNAIEPTVTDPNTIEPAVADPNAVEPAVADPNVVGYNLAKVSEMITRHEGKSSKMYLDTKGIPTVGIGFNLQRPDARSKLKDLGLDYDKVIKKKQFLTEKQINNLFKYSLERSIKLAKSFVSNFNEHPAHIQEVLIDMAFNLGPNNLAEFQKFKTALLKKDYAAAAKEMTSSKWHKQVGNRAIELEKIMREK